MLPVYKTIALNTPISVCSRSPAGDGSTNKLGNRVFLRFDNDAARLVTIQVTGAAAGSRDGGRDRSGHLRAAPGRARRSVRRCADAAADETMLDRSVRLPPGLYIIEVYDFEHRPGRRARSRAA